MRVFIAVKFNADIKNSIDSVRETIEKESKRGNFTPKDNYHLTLKFIGEVSPDETEDIARAAALAASRNRAFDITLSHIGYFARQGGLIPWIGADDSEQLKKLVSTVERELEKCGYKRERRPFKSHITLGREVTLKADKKDFINTIKFDALNVHVSEIYVMESVRQGGKLIYKPLFCARLKS